MKRRRLVVLLLVALVMLSCKKEEGREYVTEVKTTLAGQFELKPSRDLTGTNAQISGRYFIGSGAVSGTANTERYLEFTWGRNPNERFTTTLPRSKVVIRIDNDKDRPVVEYTFTRYHQEEFATDVWRNPNQYVMGDGMTTATVYISDKTLTAEPILQ